MLRFLADNGITAQAILDRANDRFAPVWYPRYFRVANPTMSLDFTTIIGRSRVEAMASIIGHESEFPTRSRAGLEKVQGEVPTIAVQRQMTARDLRDLEILRRTPGLTDRERINSIIDYVFNDFQYAGNTVNKAVDAMALQAISTGAITINAANNPDGISFTVPLLQEQNRKLNPVKAWTDPTADIIKDIEDAVEDGDSIANVTFEKVLVSLSLWRTISRNQSVRDFVQGYNNPGSNAKFAVTLATVNEALVESQLPPFEIVNEKTGVEKDGIITPYKAWAEDNAVFIPSGELGVIHNSYADEQITPIEGVQYGLAGRILISRWRQRKPVIEWTSGEWKAFPGVEQIDQIFIMDTATPAA